MQKQQKTHGHTPVFPAESCRATKNQEVRIVQC